MKISKWLFDCLIYEIRKHFGYEVTFRKILKGDKKSFPQDIRQDSVFRQIYGKCSDFTITSKERMYALYQAGKYIINANIDGDFVECGVWKGGSSMLMAHTLLCAKETNRKIYLYDTFRGMPRPGKKDIQISDGKSALDIWESLAVEGGSDFFCYSSIDETRRNVLLTGYPPENLIFVKGKVEDTIPKIIPPKIAILRLDTDWFESTYHELKHLFPILSPGGVIIIDDYGYWTGVKEAVDKYFSETDTPIFLSRVDDCCRVGVKISGCL